MLSILTLLTVALGAIAHTAPDKCPRKVGAEGVQVRIPPTFNTTDHAHHGRSWRPPPIGFYFQPWSMILASNPQYAAMRNVQYDPTPIDPSEPTGLVNDLFSFQFPGNDTIITTYGVDTPHPSLPAVLDFAGTGILVGATCQYSILVWGCDANRVPYYASYSTAVEFTQTPPGIDLMSTSDQGPDQETIDAVLKALKKLGNEEITKYVVALERMVQDGGRRGYMRRLLQDESGPDRDRGLNVVELG